MYIYIQKQQSGTTSANCQPMQAKKPINPESNGVLQCTFSGQLMFRPFTVHDKSTWAKLVGNMYQGSTLAFLMAWLKGCTYNKDITGSWKERSSMQAKTDKQQKPKPNRLILNILSHTWWTVTVNLNGQHKRWIGVDGEESVVFMADWWMPGLALEWTKAGEEATAGPSWILNNWNQSRCFWSWLLGWQMFCDHFPRD